MKIAVIGWSGAGKSTLTRHLAGLYGIEPLHLDTVNFKPGWVERTREEKDGMIRAFLDTHDAWAIDGDYTRYSFDRRMEEADAIVQLRFSPLSCLLRVCRRYRTWKGKSRPDMTEGCQEKLDWEFVKWVLWKGRGKKRAAPFDAAAARYPDKTVILKNQRQLDAYLAHVDAGGHPGRFGKK